MKSNLKKTIFNPDDKLSESKPETTHLKSELLLQKASLVVEPKEETQKHYLELIPYEKADIARKNKFKFDVTNKKWYTTDENHPLLNDFKKKVIDFTSFRKQNNLYFDGDTKEWYTYSSNEMFKNV